LFYILLVCFCVSGVLTFGDLVGGHLANKNVARSVSWGIFSHLWPTAGVAKVK